jgi:hypothetical protein
MTLPTICLKPVFSDPIAHSRGVLPDPLSDLIQRESLCQATLQKPFVHGGILASGTDGNANVCSRPQGAGLARHPLRMCNALDERGALAVQLRAALVVALLLRLADLVLYAALLELHEVHLHRLP